MKSPLFLPCHEWADKLAVLYSKNLSSADREALDAHLASCSICKAVAEEYRELDERLHEALCVRQPLQVSSELLHIGNTESIEEEGEMTRGMKRDWISLRRPAFQFRSGRSISSVRTMFNVVTTLLAIGIIISGFYLLAHTPHTTLTATPSIVDYQAAYQAAYQIPVGWKLLIHDPMEAPAHSGWLNSPPGCTFKNGMYHIALQSQNYCLNTQTDIDPSFGLLHSYTYEIQLALLQGQQSGMLFCKTHKSFYKSLKSSYPPYYYFGITTDGKYVLFYDDGESDRGLISGNSSYIKKGLKTFNTLAVTADKGEIDMYINGHLVGKYKETTNSCDGGIVGVEASGFPLGVMNPTEVVYKNMRLWGP